MQAMADTMGIERQGNLYSASRKETFNHYKEQYGIRPAPPSFQHSYLHHKILKSRLFHSMPFISAARLSAWKKTYVLFQRIFNIVTPLSHRPWFSQEMSEMGSGWLELPSRKQPLSFRGEVSSPRPLSISPLSRLERELLLQRASPGSALEMVFTMHRAYISKATRAFPPIWLLYNKVAKREGKKCPHFFGP